VPAFVKDAKPLLATATDVSPDLRRLGTQASPTVRRLKPTAQRLSTFASKFAPVVRIADQAGGLDGLLGIMNGWVKTIQNSDGLGHVFRLRLQVDDTLAGHLLDSLGLNMPAAKRTRKAAKQPAADKPPAPAAAAPAPAAPAAPEPESRPKLKLPIPEIPGTTLDDKLRDPQQAVGDVGKLLDYLMGG
jgi:hypothetical protein